MSPSSSPIRILSPEEIATREAGATPFIRFPDPGSLFRERALRLRQLAAGHPMRDYLIFVADLADAQQHALARDVALTLPSREALADAARAGVAPLSTGRWPLGEAWRDDLSTILADLMARTPSGQARDVMGVLAAADAAHLDQQAERLLGGVMLGLDLAGAPLIGAALQVHWSRLVSQTQKAYPELAFDRVDDDTLCPCCAGRPTASVVRMGGDAPTRYLHCGLCAAEWHRVRIQCSHCGLTTGIHYQELDPQAGAAEPAVATPRGAVRAECCDECRHYLKIVSQDRDALVDPVADDLASITLDLLVSESGLERHGVNLMLLFGDDSADTAKAIPAEGS